MTQEQEVADRIAGELRDRVANECLRVDDFVNEVVVPALLTSREEGYRQGVGARVKPLVWTERRNDYVAAPEYGPVYTIERHYWHLLIDGRHTKPHKAGGREGHLTLADAKLAAQADYEQRIMSALEPGDGSRTPSPKPELTGDE